MMGRLGLSYVGAVYLAMLFIPNILWSRTRPKDHSAQGENWVLRVLEGAGQAGCTCCALVFSDFNLRPFSPWSLWLLASFGLMVLYELWWLRYFKGPRRQADFYSSFLGIPVAGATLPVGAFLLLGIYGRVIWMVLSALVLGVGHIGIHLGHWREMEK